MKSQRNKIFSFCFSLFLSPFFNKIRKCNNTNFRFSFLLILYKHNKFIELAKSLESIISLTIRDKIQDWKDSNIRSDSLEEPGIEAAELRTGHETSILTETTSSCLFSTPFPLSGTSRRFLRYYPFGSSKIPL